MNYAIYFFLSFLGSFMSFVLCAVMIFCVLLAEDIDEN